MTKQTILSRFSHHVECGTQLRRVIIRRSQSHLRIFVLGFFLDATVVPQNPLPFLSSLSSRRKLKQNKTKTCLLLPEGRPDREVDLASARRIRVASHACPSSPSLTPPPLPRQPCNRRCDPARGFEANRSPFGPGTGVARRFPGVWEATAFFFIAVCLGRGKQAEQIGGLALWPGR